MKKIYLQLLIVCAGFFLLIGTLSAQQVHLHIPIIQGNDDAEEVTTDMWDPIGTVYLGSSDLELAWDDGRQYDGMLFRDVQIPAGATIDSAYVQFVAKDESSDVINLIVYGDKSADADTIATTPLGNISSRTRTTAVVNWSPEPWLAEFDALPAQRTPDLKSVISEIIALDGWASGNKIMIIVTQDGQTEPHRNAYSYDSDEGAPVLHVWFSDITTGSKLVQKAGFRYSIYPNPTEGKLYISNPSSDQFSFNVYNINGKLVKSRQNITDTKAELNMDGLIKGLYFIRLTSGEKIETHKIILK